MSRRTLAVAVWVGLAIFFCTPRSQAQEAWERIAVLGVNTRAVGFGSTSVFAGTARGVWRSDDQGVTWVQSVSPSAIAEASIMDLVVSPNFASDHTVFVITIGGFIWRSTDADTTFTFQIVGNPFATSGPNIERTPGTSLAIHPLYLGGGSGSNQVLFAGFYGDGLYYSANAGDPSPANVTWAKDTSRPIKFLWDLAISPSYASDGLLVLGGASNDGPVWLRNSSGSTVNKSYGIGGGATDIATSLLWPSDSASSNNLVFVGTMTHGMYKATDFKTGPTWCSVCDSRCLSVPPPCGTSKNCVGTVGRVYAMARSTGSTPKFIEGRSDGLLWSDDDAANCTTLDLPTDIQEVEFQPGYNGTTGCYVFIGTPSGLFRRVVGTCSTATNHRGPEVVDGFAVALAGDGAGKFMGSLSQGLLKCVSTGANPGNMVRYNNFPNKQIPQIVAICLDPIYNETFDYGTFDCGSQDQSFLFVAANFPDAPEDNCVYKSSDFGNTWEKVDQNWSPAAGKTITFFDLAISPAYRHNSSSEAVLYAATSAGLFRWDNTTPTGWKAMYTLAPVYAVGLPPNYTYSSGTCHAVFISTEGIQGTSPSTYLANQVLVSSDNGLTFESARYSSLATPRGRVTAFAFPQDYTPLTSSVHLSATTFPTSQTGVTGGVYRCYKSGTTWYWTNKTNGVSALEYSFDIAAEPAFWTTGHYDLLVATSGGLYKTTDANLTSPNWSQADTRATYSVTYDPTDTTGGLAMAGFQGKKSGSVLSTGAVLLPSETSSWLDFWGYHFLPDDVWASVAHERDPKILFSSSPSMGVFVSEDKGISFRPWNKGFGSSVGPCPLRTGLGINMLADRRGSHYDIVWVGTDGDGIKSRNIYYNTTTSPATIDLETADGVDANGWLHNTWLSGGADITGRWERIEVAPNGACSYPVLATSPAQGFASLQGDLAVCATTTWKLQNTGLGSLAATGVRQGYQALQSGTPLNGESVPYHQWNYYQVQVPVGTQDLQVAMNDLDDMGSLDPDLYLRHGALPTLALHDYNLWINGDETVCVRPSATLLSAGFSAILSENFASGIPGTWSVVDGGSGGLYGANTWTTANPGSRTIGAPFSSPFAIVDSDRAGGAATQDEQLVTPVLNLSGYSAVFLTFSNQFRYYAGYGTDVADVDVSTDGGTNWTNLLRMTGADDGYATPNTKRLDLTAYAGKPSVKIRFRYTGAYDWWWAVDNVEVTGLPVGWSIRHAGSVNPPAGGWSTANPCGQAPTSLLSAPFVVADASCAAAGSTFDEILYTPTIDCSAYSKVTLTFDHQINCVSGVAGYLYVSNNAGSSWYTYRTYSTSAGPVTETVNISSVAAGKSAVAVRFYYQDAGTTSGGWWALDNIQINGEGPKPGTWYIGVYGYSGTNSTYDLLATRNTGCTATPPGFQSDGGKRAERNEAGCEEGFHQPEAPSSSSAWGTVSGSGVYKGSGSASAIETVSWEQRNGTTSPLTNLYANTIVQLSDLTLIVGCDGDVFYSPAPDEGATTWVNATSHMGNPGSNDFRDLLVASNGDVLIAANGTDAGTAAGGVWLSGDEGAHWMRLSSGFDVDSQKLTDLVADSGTPPSYYASTGETGEYTRTITADPYPTVSTVNPATGPATGGTTVTITGTGFLGTCPTGTAADCPMPNDKPTVLFGESEVTPASWTATSITCTTPAGTMGNAKVTVRNPDTRRSTSGPNFLYACASPSPAGTLTATDYSAYDFTGVRVLWSQPGSWGDGTDTGRTQIFFRDGYSVSTLLYTSGSRTDTPPAKVASHTYFVRQNNACALFADTNSASAADDAEAGAYTTRARDLKWHAGGKSQLDWGAVTNATIYTVYRGSGTTISNLTGGGGAAVCAAYSGSTANTGATLTATPSSGQFYWYLVTASSGTAEGTLGTTSSGAARKVASTGGCSTP